MTAAGDRLVETADVKYQMQSWSHADACICGFSRNTEECGHVDGCPYPTTTHSWVPMENGAGSARWKPKTDARAAVQQAATWAGGCGGVGIPAMQVVEIPSGRVIWRDSHRYPAAGAPIAPEWQAEVYAAANAEYDERLQKHEAAQQSADPEPADYQETLF